MRDSLLGAKIRTNEASELKAVADWLIDEVNQEKERVFGASVELCLSSTPQGFVWIDSLISLESRGSGVGSSVLRMVCSIADKHQVVLILNVSPLALCNPEDDSTEEAVAIEQLNAQMMDSFQLKGWYGSHGFESLPGSDNVMVRRAVKPRPARKWEYETASFSL
ncbi:hypothetical protein ACYPKM_04460 [Pseudomonas aeruginosa]